MSLTFTQQKKPSSSLIPARRGQPEHQTTFQPPEAQEAPPQPGFGHEFSKVDVLPSERTGQQFAQSCPLALPSPRACPFGGACHTCPAPVQAKLTISQPGDKYEQEADRAADAVMTMPEPRNGQRLQRECSECEDEQAQRQPEEEEEEEEVGAKLLQRQPEEEEEEEVSTKLLQRQPEEEEEEEETVSPKAQPDRTPRVTPGVAANIKTLRSGGQPLSPSSRAFFEPRFGHDFGQVRVHTDSKAADTAKTVNARAFTVGRDIVFGGGQYAPDTQGGRRLMAHELAHVVQTGRNNKNSTRSAKRNIFLANNEYLITAGSHRSLSMSKFTGSKAEREYGDDIQRSVAVAGLTLGAIAFTKDVVDSPGALSYRSDQLTYPKDLKRVGKAKPEKINSAGFTSLGLFSNNKTKFSLHGDFSNSYKPANKKNRVMANVYFDLDETTEYSQSALSFHAKALQTPYGTAENPKVRFVCSGRFNPYGPGDCRYRVLLEVDQHASVRAIESKITAGKGDLRRFGPIGFHLWV